jgi:hypothetical protein
MRTFQRVSRLIRPSIGLPVLAGLALVGLLVASLGCDGNGRGERTLPPKWSDIPIAPGFEIVPGKSNDTTAGGNRRVSHVYKGDAKVPVVSEYYRRHMPELGWTLVRESFVGGRQRFMFNKANESCHIIVYDDWGTKVQIEVWPFGARTAETHPAPAAPAPGAAR